jgi:hypothetical protein
MVDVQTVSIMLASASVIAGVIYYAFQIRQQTKIRQMDFIMRMPFPITSKDAVQIALTIKKAKFENFEDFEKKYYVEARQVGDWSENLGVLVKRKLVDISLVYDIYGDVDETWEKLKPWIEETRRRANNPKVYEWFEYLYNEMKKREQKLQQEGVKNG